jgi:radical SAM superfamily enzyme YgiQ (UPF0313 family)
MYLNFNEIQQKCKHLNISEDIFHAIQIQLFGVYLNMDYDPFNIATKFKEIHLKLPTNSRDTFDAVPRKLGTVSKSQSPYYYDGKNIFYNGTVIFNSVSIEEVPLPEKDKPRYLKGYSFPFLGTLNPYFELRINPKNTGRCPGRCVFCHREYSYRNKPDTVNFMPPKEIIAEIIKNHGKDVFSKVSHIAFISELFGKEDNMLSYLEELRTLLQKVGITSKTTFSSIAQDIRTKEGLTRLLKIQSNKQYSTTLETFSNRKAIMGGYKGLPIESFIRILEIARETGFQKIKLNYVAGLETFEAFEKGIRNLKQKNLVDCIGMSIFTIFFREQITHRLEEAKHIEYYINIIRLLEELEIKIYKPQCFEMGYPLQLVQNISTN